MFLSCVEQKNSGDRDNENASSKAQIQREVIDRQWAQSRMRVLGTAPLPTHWEHCVDAYSDLLQYESRTLGDRQHINQELQCQLKKVETMRKLALRGKLEQLAEDMDEVTFVSLKRRLKEKLFLAAEDLEHFVSGFRRRTSSTTSTTSSSTSTILANEGPGQKRKSASGKENLSICQSSMPDNAITVELCTCACRLPTPREKNLL